MRDQTLIHFWATVGNVALMAVALWRGSWNVILVQAVNCLLLLVQNEGYYAHLYVADWQLWDLLYTFLWLLMAKALGDCWPAVLCVGQAILVTAEYAIAEPVFGANRTLANAVYWRRIWCDIAITVFLAFYLARRDKIASSATPTGDNNGPSCTEASRSEIQPEHQEAPARP